MTRDQIIAAGEIIPKLPKLLEGAAKVAESIGELTGRNEIREQQRLLNEEETKGEQSSMNLQSVMDGITDDTQQENDKTRILTSVMQEQGQALKDMVDQRKAELQRLEVSMARVDGMLRSYEARFARLAPALVTTGATNLLA